MEVEKDMQETGAVEKRWYLVHTSAGNEAKVKAELLKRIKSAHLEDRILRVEVPTEMRIEYRGNKPRKVEKVIYPGYVFVEVVIDPTKGAMDSDTWTLIRFTPGVHGFVSVDGRPSPVDDEEMLAVLNADKDEMPKLDIEVGEQVEVIDGPFRGKEGRVTKVDHERKRVYVAIHVFGREVIAELDFVQVRKKK